MVLQPSVICSCTTEHVLPLVSPCYGAESTTPNYQWDQFSAVDFLPYSRLLPVHFPPEPILWVLLRPTVTVHGKSIPRYVKKVRTGVSPTCSCGNRCIENHHCEARETTAQCGKCLPHECVGLSSTPSTHRKSWAWWHLSSQSWGGRDWRMPGTQWTVSLA